MIQGHSDISGCYTWTYLQSKKIAFQFFFNTAGLLKMCLSILDQLLWSIEERYPYLTNALQLASMAQNMLLGSPKVIFASFLCLCDLIFAQMHGSDLWNNINNTWLYWDEDKSPFFSVPEKWTFRQANKVVFFSTTTNRIRTHLYFCIQDNDASHSNQTTCPAN